MSRLSQRIITLPPPDAAPDGNACAERPRRSRDLVLIFVALALCVPLLSTLYIGLHIPQIEREAFANLNAIARLQADQIEDWLQKRAADLEVTMSREYFIGRVNRLQRDDNPTLRATVAQNLSAMRAAYEYKSVTLLDARGAVVANDGDLPSIADDTRALLDQAATTRGVAHSQALIASDGAPTIYFAAPLFQPGQNGKTTLTGFIMTGLDLEQRVFPYLEQWPTPSPSGETLLVQRDRDELVYLSALRPSQLLPPLRSTLSRNESAAARAILADQPATSAIVDVDYRGVPVFAAYRRIAGSSWYLMSKIDRAELLAPMWRNLLWIGAIALAATLAMMVALLVLWRQRAHSEQLSLLAEKARADQLLNDFFKLPFVSMVIVSPKTRRFTRFNDQCCVLSGYSRDELLEKTYEDLTHPDDYPKAYAKVLKISRGEADTATFEQRLIRKDGSVIFINADMKGVRRSDGSLDYLLGTAQDITPRKMHEIELNAANTQLKAKQTELSQQNTILRQAEAALRSSIERYEAVTQSSNDALINADSQGIIVAWNPGAERIFGYRSDEIIGQSLERLMPQRYRAAHPAYMQRALSGGDSQVIGSLVELTGLRNDGSEFDIDLSLTRWAVADGIYFTATIRDITQRKKTEQSLRLLSEAVRQSPEAIVITDTQARIEFVNEAFIANTGYDRDEVVGKTPRLLNSGKTPPEAYAAMWAALARGESWKGEFLNQRKDGSLFAEFANVAPIRQADGRISHYVAVKEDITEKRRLAQELDNYRFHLEEVVSERTAQLAEAGVKAEAANVAKSSFLANMSHEIRTPMNAIVGLTHLLRNSEPTPKQLDRLIKIDTAAAHLLELINNILDLSKIEANKMTLEDVDFSLISVFDGVRSMVTDQAREKRLTLVLEPGNTPPWLRGDPNRLRQALLNYAANAVKFTEQGRVTLSATVLEENGPDLLIRFAVDDSGVGIAAEKLPSLFQAFEQADASTTRKYGGTGLGLAITRRLALLMGGDVGVRSERQRGSTFWFTARLKRGADLQPPPRQENKGDHEAILRRDYAGARILLADDVEINLEVAQLLLHGVGMQVDTARNGREAVDKVRISAYDLILMDVQMPVMNGLDATLAIRGLSGRAQIPILAMTANAFDEDRRSCLAAGMNDFIAKPVDPDALYGVLRNWLPRNDGAPDLALDEPSPLEAPSSALAALKRRLANVPGLNVDKGLGRLRGNQEKYNHVLGLFLQQHALDAEKIAAALDADQMTSAEQLAHSLKGSAGLLGAAPVAELATALLSALRQHSGREDIELHFAALAPELRALIAGLQQALSAADAAPEAQTSEDDQQRLMNLEQLLVNGELQVLSVAREQSQFLLDALGKESGMALISAIEVFDFERALTLLRAARPS